MNEQAILDERAQERRVAATARTLSESVRDSPLGQLLAAAGAGVDFAGALQAFVADQWEAHLALKELRGNDKKRPREEESSDSCAAGEE